MPTVGDVLAERYQIESVLGAGGMASVYRATDLRLDRQVAVKVLVANLAADPLFAERFNREAGAMAGFSHPNVVAVYDVEPGDPETGREPFYVMEYCDGGSLADRLRAGPIPPAELIPTVVAIGEGLAELHRQGLVHRDIKPANILFSSDRPKLADFGVVWSDGPHDGEPLTLPGSMVGTLPYLAPELVAGEPPSPASDVYALGVTIFQALTGRYPEDETGSAAAAGLGSGLAAPLDRAMAADPAVRPAPTELASELAKGVEVWGVARPNAGAIAAGVDMDAATVVAMEPPAALASVPGIPPAAGTVGPVMASRPVAGAAPAVQRRPSGRPGLSGYVGPAIIVAAIVLAVLLIPRFLGGAQAVPGASPGISTAAPVTAQPSAPGAILAALDQVDTAIAAARGGKDGLSGRDANELTQLADTVRTAVDRGDLNGAATATQTLADRARAVTDKLDKPRRDALLAAIDALGQALRPT